MLVPNAVSGTTIDVTRQSENSFQLTLTIRQAIGVAEAQRALLSTALELCGGKRPHLGNYRFKRTEVLHGDSRSENQTFVFVQNISCHAKPLAKVKPTRVISLGERTEIERKILRLTRSFQNALAKGHFQTSYDMLSESMKTMSSYTEWKTGQEAFRKMFGPMLELDVWRVTVYVDPPRAPEPGIYVAADYEASYENVPIRCGFLMWHEREKKRFRVVRDESGHLKATMLAMLSKSDIESIKRRLGCRIQ